jgi:hypothetical protein
MSKARVARLLAVLVVSAAAFAQSPCPTATLNPSATFSGDLVCLVPQVYGPGGLVGTNNAGPINPTTRFHHEVHFQASSVESFSPLNSEIGVQLSQLPFASPASGFVFSFNPSLGVVSRTTESFGPILTERADTIGRHKLFVGISYQYFDFDKVDGVDLRNFGAVFHHEPIPGNFVFANDIVSTSNRVDLKVHQVTAVATFGLTNRLDLSVAIPIVDVRMGFSSAATIVSFESPCCIHNFAIPSPYPSHERVLTNSQAIFSNANSALGVGDVVFRGKFQAVKGEKAGLAFGMDVHAPTGDAKNFLGSGTAGVRPFATFSYAARISPHATVGYLWNGQSILAGNITAGTSAHLPDVVTYSAGADAGVTRRLTLAADFIGQSLRNATQIRSSSFVDFLGTSHPNIAISTGTINQASVAVGGKANLVGRLVFSADVLFRVNDAGLHSKPVPLAGISYTF